MKLLFVTEPGSLRAQVAGGVQLCTADFISLLQACSSSLEVFEIDADATVARRLLVKLGLDVYGKQYASAKLDKLARHIRDNAIDVVAINQVSLLGIATHLRKLFGQRLRIVCLSHGNESGDYLHEVARSSALGIRTWRNRWVLGSLLLRESRFFINDVDVVLSISDTERQINNWLGAQHSVFIPRIFEPAPLAWKPVAGRVGFLGSLNHKPNIDGLIHYLDALQFASATVRVRIVGGPAAIGEQLQRQYPAVDYVGALPDEAMHEELATWSLFLNPVFWFSRGASTKLAIAINSGIPVVTTAAGARGYSWSAGKLVVADTPAAMVSETLGLLTDQAALVQAREAILQVGRSGPSRSEIAKRVVLALQAQR